MVAKDLTGRADISTINGRTEAEFRQLPKSHIKASSVNGSVLVTIPSDANADIHASTVHGGIETDFGLRARNQSFVGHDLDGKLGSGGTEIELSNVNGSIQLRHANDGKTLSPATSSTHHGKDDDDDDGTI